MRRGTSEAGGDELVFEVLRTLMTAYLLWGWRSAVQLPELCRLLSTTEARLRPVLYPLFRDGWIGRDEHADTVHLTRSGVHHFMGLQAATAVEFPLPKWQ